MGPLIKDGRERQCFEKLGHGQGSVCESRSVALRQCTRVSVKDIHAHRHKNMNFLRAWVFIRVRRAQRTKRATEGVWGLSPQQGLGAEPPGGGSGGEAPGNFLFFQHSGCNFSLKELNHCLGNENMLISLNSNVSPDFTWNGPINRQIGPEFSTFIQTMVYNINSGA